MDPTSAAAPVAFQTSATGRIRTWNTDCQNLLGYTSDAVLRRSIACILEPSAKMECKDRLARSRESACRWRTAALRTDGRRLDLYLTFVPQFIRDKRFDGYDIIVDAITEFDPEPMLSGLSQGIFQQVLDSLAGTFAVVDPSGQMLVWNRKLEQVSQMTREEVRAAHVLDLFDPQDKAIVQARIQQVYEHGDASLEAAMIAKDGTATPYLFNGSRIELNGKAYLCGMGLDISKQKEQEEMLRLSNRALHASVNGIVITRAEGKDNPIVYINPAFERISGYQEAEAIGRDSRFMAAPGLDDIEREKIRGAIDECKETHVIFRNLRKDGELFWNELTIAPVQNNKGDVTHFIGVINDVTASKQRTFHLEHEANHDPLTGLANRNLFWDRLEQAIYTATRNRTLVAVVFIDLDRFKIINDSEGHEAGDEVLRAVSKRLKASVRENDTVARLGGDEFVLVLVNQPSLRYTLQMIERLRESISQPVRAGDKELNVGASIGVSVFPHDGASGNTLLQAADAAMYHAKAAGRNSAQFFSHEMKSTMDAKHELENNLREALDNHEMFLVFQPRLCLKTSKIIGAEALLRWRHPKRGVLHPASFMPLAQESGLIVPLGEWVLATACSTLNRFQRHGLDDFVVSVNVSLNEFSRPDYAVMLDELVTASGIAADRLEIEIAEHNLMRNPQYSIGVLSELDQLGVKLAIDDFGAGYSSLSCLQKFAVSHLEIDQSFIADLSVGGADAMISKTVITMGHNLAMEVVAKGVETNSQLDFLKRCGCDQIQGNYFSGPVHAPELERLMKSDAMLRY